MPNGTGLSQVEPFGLDRFRDFDPSRVEDAMIGAAITATWWVGLGLVVGVNRACTYPGPQDGLRWAAFWAAGWPLLWLTEERQP